MKRALFLIPLVLLWCGNHGSAMRDTGTYKIEEYRVKLVPDQDGVVSISYYQKWLVTGGYIPWITVGTANSDFSIVEGSAGGAVRKIKANKSRNWSGVRITLDRDYQKGETFEVECIVNQGGLFYADKGGYRLDYSFSYHSSYLEDNHALDLSFSF